MSFSNPQSNLETLGIPEGGRVADLGTGSGFYAIAAAKLVGDGGKVYAVDVQQDLLTRLTATAHQEKLNNIETIHGNMEKIGGTKIGDHAVDVALVCNVLFQIEFKEEFVKEIKRILKPEGRVLVIDWTDSFNGMGPGDSMVITEDAAKALFEKAGFVLASSFDAGDNHYGLIYRKS